MNQLPEPATRTSYQNQLPEPATRTSYQCKRTNSLNKNKKCAVTTQASFGSIFGKSKKAAVKTNSFSGPFHRKGIGPVIATALLLMVSVSSFVVFQNWYQTYSSDLFGQIEQVSANSVELEYLEPYQLYVRNFNSIDINVTDVSIDGKSCSVNDIINPNTIDRVDLGVCLSGMSTGQKEVILFTDKGVFTKTLMLKAVYTGDFLASFSNGACEPGYTRVFGLESISDSHAEGWNGTNYVNNLNLCLKHNAYTLGTSCSGNHTTLFHLDNVSNAHAFTNKTSSYKPISTWHDVCVSISGGGTISSVVNATDPQDGSLCAGSLEQIDNVYGAHMGNCNAYPTKVWVRVS